MPKQSAARLTRLLAAASRLFAFRCIRGLEADREKCEGNIERSLALSTALAPVIGYDRAAMIARTAYGTGRTVREVALELSGLDRTKLDELLLLTQNISRLR